MELELNVAHGFESDGNAFADSELSADGALLNFARRLGDNPTFEFWEAGRLAWQKGYSMAKAYDIDADATTKAWSRFADRLKATYAITKPKKGGDAEVKADQREKAKAVIDTLMTKSYEELESEARMLLATPTLANLNKSKPIIKAIEQKRKDDESDQSKALKVIQANIVADVKQCFDMEILEAVHKVLNGYDFEVAG
jgi:hypothetical protein